MPAQDSAAPSLLHRSRIRFHVCLAVWGLLLFWGAGSFRWGRGWAQFALMAGFFLLNYIVLLKINPAVLLARQENNRPALPTDGLLSLMFFGGIMVLPLVAGLDARRQHLLPASSVALAGGLILQLAGNALILWSMAVNPFLEQTVRIQSDRGHQVVSGGPYRIVRHPMYAGVILLYAGMPLFLGAPWGFAPVAVIALGLSLRAAFEDRTLLAELPGYADFARRTRYRIAPGIW